MITSILHPSDLSVGNQAAFLHALRLAVASKGRFCILHSQSSPDDEGTDWNAFPGVRSALVRWGLIGADVPRSAIESQLGVRIEKVEIHSRDPIQTVLEWLDDHSCDLIVMATHARDGMERLLRGSIAEDLAGRAQLPTLFLPMASPGFVDEATGKALIRNVLVPVDRSPHPGVAVSMAFDLVDSYGCKNAVLHLLHVGPFENAPTVSLDPTHDRRLHRLARTGGISDAIVSTARELDAELIVMPTRGRQGFLDALRGSTTQRVLREAGRPLLAVPAIEG